jgi:hypothetical protein
MEPLKREFWTGIHKAIEDEVTQRKPCRGQWRKRLYLQEKAGKKSKVWQKIKLVGDASSVSYVPVRTKGNK